MHMVRKMRADRRAQKRRIRKKVEKIAKSWGDGDIVKHKRWIDRTVATGCCKSEKHLNRWNNGGDNLTLQERKAPKISDF